MIFYRVTRVCDTPSGIYCDFTPENECGESGEAINLLVPISSYYDAHLREGKVISDECFEEIYELSGIAEAQKKAEWILSGGDHSKKQLVLKLVRADIDRRYAEKAALLMEERGFIDEYSQAERIAKGYCRRKYWGKKRITAELMAKGYERDAVFAAVAFITPEEYKSSLLTVIERKYPTPPEDKREKDRRIAALIRLGYSISEISEAFRESYK
ncbi:MAG: hypothetical protein E7647_04995 [Ruminococcaceae bacterium]|nr:hypothetical protein [Oscillospiraceae bacterium]